MKIGEEYLPDDFLVDILSKKVPLASLARFRLVSKGWNALIKDVIRFKKSSQIMLIDSRVYLVSIDFLGAHDNIVNIKNQFSLKEPLSNSSKEVDIHEENKVIVCPGESMVSDRFFLHIVGEDKYIQVDQHEAGSRFSLLSLTMFQLWSLLHIQQGSFGYVQGKDQSHVL
ncbi:hypothetical protein F2Q68_00017178 [Brassica cretica]|uniref:F-box domain-containing protein n=2 Tax=Brassica cretica TaxID=69181 RepID=A0ABQ7F1U7_BRACR|nr:hypothetical protein F2Q68_00017178 [Brassica cretica]KAF3609973.1 hypothetical protein DY000_02049795 [Brassica cretica]